MRLSTILSRMVTSANKRGNRSRQQRQLRMESLEPRWVFSAGPVPGAECIPVPEVTPTAEGELVASLPLVGPAYPIVPSFNMQLPPTPQQLTTPIVFQQAMVEVVAGAEGEADASVFHIEMGSRQQNPTKWTFSGLVGALAGHSGVKVDFGGLLQGHSTTVDQYGNFTYTHDFAPGTQGNVTAKAYDSAGNVTNIESEFIIT